MTSLLRWYLLYVVVGIALGAGTADADPTAKYKFEQPRNPAALALLKAGNREFDAGHWAIAAERYKAGQDEEDASVFDFNLGQCARMMGDAHAALAAYQRFLDRGRPTGDVLESVQSFVAQLRAQLAQQEQTKAMPPTGAEPGQASTPSPDRTAAAPAPAQGSEPVAASPSGWRYLGVGLGVAGLLGGGVTAYLVVDAHSASVDADDVSRSMADRTAAQHRANSRSTQAIIVGVGSGVALAMGVVTLWILPARYGRTATAWNVNMTTSGVAVSGRF